MGSIVKGYNYDIFISYRQKDNKYDGWVTTFVENLQKELEATFKKEISVYFDVNPHDGLLETHDVDESLKDKLKCLILIPIISRTYCDPEAFAWEHEFKAFVEQASKDEFGLKIKLSNGNVASRVLPIVIYDLDKQDIKLFESIHGGVLRGVEFIYKSAGVNRPLRANEDHPQDNINKTYYRDQVNKVANTIKDVVNSMRWKGLSTEKAVKETGSEDKGINIEKPVREKPQKAPKVSILYRLKNLTAFNQRTLYIIALVFMLISIGTTWLYINKPSITDKPVFRSDIPLTQSVGRLGTKAFAISPDGEYLVYVMHQELYLKQLNSDAPSEPISGTAGSQSPFFAPDDTWIGFVNYQENKIMKIPLTGGNPVTICDISEEINECNWYENEIIYADGSSIYRVPDSGGTPELLYPLNQSEDDPIVWNPQILPGKKILLFSQQLEDGGWSIVTWRLGSNKSPEKIVERGRGGRYLKSGHIAYSLNNRLYICKLNTRTNRITSEPQIITTNPVFEYSAIYTGTAQFDFSDNGILVYYEQEDTDQRNLVWSNESGSIEPITTDAKRYGHTAISFDAQYIAASVWIVENSDYQVEIINTETGNSDLFTENAQFSAWSADNSSVYYVSTITNNEVFQQPLDRSTPPELLFDIDSVSRIRLQDLTSDGRYLPLTISKNGQDDIGYYDMVNNKVEMLDYYNSPNNETRSSISPDGKWVAYQSNNSGQAAIYVAPFPGPGQPIRITSSRTANDIYFSVWDPNMTALYYQTIIPDFELWRVNILDSENDFDFEPAKSFFNGGNDFFTNYSEKIHPNGDRFLLRKLINKDPRIKIIVNWEQELEGD